MPSSTPPTTLPPSTPQALPPQQPPQPPLAANPQPSTSSPNATNPQPLVSVIIPVYNVAKLLERCVNSVLTQTYQNLEIILIDDGSTDMSGKFCDVFAQKDPRIKVIHQKNRGLSGARNAGLDLATGDFITFIDSDDDVHPELVERLYSLCRNQEVPLSICAFQELPTLTKIPTPANTSSPENTSAFVNSQNLAAPQPQPSTLTTAQTAPQLLDTLETLTVMLCEVDFSMSAWGKLYARSLFDQNPFAELSAPPFAEALATPAAKTTTPPILTKAINPLATEAITSHTSSETPIRFPEGMLHEDVGTTYKLVINAGKIAFTPEKLYYYRQNPGSITQQSFSPRKLDLITLTDQMCDDLETWARELSTSDKPAQQPIKDLQFQIQNLTKKRRAHARFSILRQMVLIDPRTIPKASRTQAPKSETSETAKSQKTPQTPDQKGQRDQQDRQSFLKTRREIVKYLRRHRSDILKNPLASRRDRLAMLSLLLGLPVFKRAWLSYQKRKSSERSR